MIKHENSEKLQVKAEKERLNEIIQFVDDILMKAHCPMKTQLIMEVAVEEIFINIASYAYVKMNSDENIVEIECGVLDHTIYLSFKDKGKAYNPLEKKDPNLNVSIDQRTIGGLGIYMVKSMVDEISYEHLDDTNILYIKKNF